MKCPSSMISNGYLIKLTISSIPLYSEINFSMNFVFFQGFSTLLCLKMQLVLAQASISNETFLLFNTMLRKKASFSK